MQTTDTMTAETMAIAPEADVYIAIKEAGEALDMPVWPVIQLVEAGQLRAIRYGRLVLVSSHDVARLGGVIA